MILKFHGTPLARGQGVCDIDRVYRERRGLTPFFNFFSELLLTKAYRYDKVHVPS